MKLLKEGLGKSSHVLLLLLGLVIFSGFSFHPVYAILTVNLDKSSYYQGQSVQITVVGASATTKLVFQLEDLTGHSSRYWQGQATTAGTYFTSWPTTSGYTTGAYSLTVRDDTTGQVIQKTFTLMPAPEPAELESETPEGAAEVIEEMDTVEAAEYIMGLSTDFRVDVMKAMDVGSAVDILVKVEVGAAVDILEGVEIDAAVEILEAAVDGGEKGSISDIMLEMDKAAVAGLVIELTEQSGADIVDAMTDKNLKEAAVRVEEIIKLKNKETDPVEAEKVLEKAGKILENIPTESLVELFIEIVGLPATPLSVAEVLEVIDLSKVLDVVHVWIGTERFDELNTVLDLLSPETLNAVFGGLSIADRSILYPRLSAETAESIVVDFIPQYDLTVTEVAVTKLGDLEYAVTGTVENIGNLEAGSFSVSLEVGTEKIGEVEVVSLVAGASTTVTFGWGPQSTGAHVLLVTADSGDTIDEIDEANNELSKPFGVELPDLSVEFESIPMALVAEQTYTIDVRVSNEEEPASFAVQLKVNDVVLRTEEIDELAAGSSMTVSFSWTPQDDGTFTLEALVDPADEVAEGDETNNSAETSVTVAAQPAPFPWLFVNLVLVMISALSVYYVYLKKMPVTPLS